MITCEIDSWWEVVVKHKELSSVLCDDLAGWDGEWRVGGRSKREGIYVYIQLIPFIALQELIQHCEATIYQFLFFFFKESRMIKCSQSIEILVESSDPGFAC